MAWIESHIDLGDHPKVYGLFTALNVRKAEAVGFLHLLWHFTMKFSWRNGDLSKFSRVIIARSCGWDGDENVFIDALINNGFLDNSDTLKVHDWQDFAGRLVQDRLYNEKRRRKTSVKRRKNPVILALPTLPNQPNQPNHTIPTIEDVRSYCLERNNGVDPQRWFDFYSAKGWMIGKNKIRDWKAAVRTWEQKVEKKADTRRYL